MIVDASALVAMTLDEPEARAFAEAVDEAGRCLTHPVSVYEATLAVARSWRREPEVARGDLLSVLDKADIEVIAIGPNEASAALEAFARYGKGRHPAQLNMGDCFSYACAKLRGVPLLYKGDDFAKTDLA